MMKQYINNWNMMCLKSYLRHGTALLFGVLMAIPVIGQTSKTKERYEKQTKAGRFYAGGDFGVGLGFKSSSLSYSNATTLVDASFTPKIGFFPAHKLMVGFSTDISSSLTVVEGQDQYAISNISFDPFIRYHFLGGVFVEGMAGLGNGTEAFIPANEDNKLTNDFKSKRFAIGLGISNYWFERCSFEILLRYSDLRGNFLDIDGGRPIELTGFSVKAGIGVSIGK